MFIFRQGWRHQNNYQYIIKENYQIASIRTTIHDLTSSSKYVELIISYLLQEIIEIVVTSLFVFLDTYIKVVVVYANLCKM